MIYFTSDQHFGHANIIRFCNRPFQSVAEMNAAMIERWNAKVNNSDTVYILGDLFFRTREVEPVLEKLRGKKHLILGNHDRSWLGKVDLSRHFESVGCYAQINDSGRFYMLCHYPLLSYEHDRTSYMIHGHIHNNVTADFWPLIVKRERVLNASVEVNDYSPVSFDELLRNNKSFKANAGDKHGNG